MNALSLFGWSLTGIASLSILAGCSGGAGTAGALGTASLDGASSPAGHAVTTSLLRATSRRPGLSLPGETYTFVSDNASNAVYAYSSAGSSGQPLTLTGFKGPQGLAVDGRGNLFVADTFNSRIQVFAPPYTGTPKTLSDPTELPLCVSVDGNGNVAATTLDSTEGAGGSVSFFANGATSPTNLVTGSAFGYVDCGAFDAHGNYYVDGYASSNGKPGNPVVGEVVNGVKGTTIVALTTNNVLTSAAGLQVTTSGQIAVFDYKAHVIYTYAPPVGGSLGSPVSTTTLQGTDTAFLFAFTQHNDTVVTADQGLDEFLQYSYPQGGSPTKTFGFASGDLPTGVAVYPPEVP